MTADATSLAARLRSAWEAREPVEPLSATDGLTDVADAYAVQAAWTDRRLAAGERILGRKIGLTSRAVQAQMGVDEPDYGTLWASRYFAAPTGRTELPADTFLQPRVEGEIAFLLGDPPPGPVVTIQQVLAATEAVASSIEIVDSRIADWRITLPDTVADNASYGGFVLGPWSASLVGTDLRTLGMTITRNGEHVAEGVGAAALGHPARAVAWLLTKLASLGVEVQPGDVVLSGALGPTVPAHAGDVFTLEMRERPALTIAFA
jgi:2-keto-4-pentenoate hydratase